MSSQEAPQTTLSSHRLPTVSASHALHSLHARGARTVPTGIAQLDRLLAPPSLPGHVGAGGYMRGKVTDVVGPPGAGKTAFGVQAAVNALREGRHVVWIDAACAPLVPQRLLHAFSASREASLPHSGAAAASPPHEAPREQVSSRFHHMAAPTLAHVLALFMHSPAAFPPQNVSLVVIDSLSTLIDNAYPRNVEGKNRNDQTRWAAGRRSTVINELMATFTKFAALHDIALLLTCQTTTRIRGTARALLVPAISGTEWENGVSTRLILFRDWIRQGKAKATADLDRLRKARFAGVVKVNGVALADEGGVGSVASFAIENAGICDISVTADDVAAPIVVPMHTGPLKRPFAEVNEDAGEEPTSDEVYGWIEDDEVAAEGLLIDDASVPDLRDAAQLEPTGRSNKMMRPSTL